MGEKLDIARRYVPPEFRDQFLDSAQIFLEMRDVIIFNYTFRMGEQKKFRENGIIL